MKTVKEITTELTETVARVNAAIRKAGVVGTPGKPRRYHPDQVAAIADVVKRIPRRNRKPKQPTIS